MYLSQANRFRFGLKILVQSKAIWFGLEIVLGKIERFYIIQKFIDRKQNVLIWSTYCRNESKTICLCQGAFNYATYYLKFGKSALN